MGLRRDEPEAGPLWSDPCRPPGTTLTLQLSTTAITSSSSS